MNRDVILLVIVWMITGVMCQIATSFYLHRENWKCVFRRGLYPSDIFPILGIIIFGCIGGPLVGLVDVILWIGSLVSFGVFDPKPKETPEPDRPSKTYR